MYNTFTKSLVLHYKINMENSIKTTKPKTVKSPPTSVRFNKEAAARLTIFLSKNPNISLNKAINACVVKSLSNVEHDFQEGESLQESARSLAESASRKRKRVRQ